MEDRLEDLHTCSWGYVTSYDAASQSCTVQLVLRRQFVVEGGQVQSERPAPLVSVPVVFPGAGDYSITWPLKSGDVVLVVFAERAMHQWNAGGQEDLEPDDGRMHSMSDAVAIPGLRPRTKPIDDPPDNAVVVTVPDGETVRLGDKTASESAVAGDTYRAAEDAYFSALEGIIGAIISDPAISAYFAGAGGGAAAAAAWGLAVTAFHLEPSAYLARKVKVK